MKKAILVSVLFATLSFSFAYPIANAQTIGTQSIDGIDIQSTPANPAPGSNITVSVESYSTDLTAATISWSINGNVVTKGVGMESIQTVAPAIGKTLKVLVTINTITGAQMQKEISITSGSVDIVWESSGYVPPLYEGKTPFAYQNTITFTAMPNLVDKNGVAINPKNLVYQWKENTFVLGSMSGYDKQSIQITGSVIAQPIAIDVTVSSEDGSAHAENGITLNPVAPSILFYQDDPLYGILYNNAVTGTLQLTHNETKVTAAPYGFDIPGADFTYNWSINGITQAALSASRSVILGINGSQQGSSDIDLSIQNTGNDILETAESAFAVVFSNQKTASSSPLF